MTRKKTLESDSTSHVTFFAVRHSMTNSSSSIATHRAAVVLCMHKYMPGIYKYVVQQCNYSILGPIVEVLGCHTRYGTYWKDEKTVVRKKGWARRELNSRPRTLRYLKLPFDNPVHYLICIQIDMDVYVRIEKWDRNSCFDQKAKTAPLPGRRREHGRGRPRQSRERRARWGTASKQHAEWWTSSRARAFTAQNLV